jgi:lipopolysaccharide/colanic/teichoic acid biosynthesis glycosyltransferase
MGRFCKDCIDRVGASVLVLLLLPVFALLALIVLIDDGRPILYRRRVVGRAGEFDAFKFRTMRRDADAILARDVALKSEFERNFKLRNDPRVTRSGALLRKYSLDELPQLFNVLQGQMSLVGPRMITAQELPKYGRHQNLLMTTKPGVTGYWQTRGRQDTSYEERVRMDIHYITNWSLGLDLRILFETPWKVISGKGAY